MKILGQALGCADGPLPKAKKAGGSSSDGESDSKGQDESRGAGDSNGAVGVAGKDAENGVVAANGSNEKEPSQQQQQQGKSREELFALSNTDDNDSLQGLVRSGGCVWIGKFGLPPMPPGKDESEVRGDETQDAAALVVRWSMRCLVGGMWCVMSTSRPHAASVRSRHTRIAGNRPPHLLVSLPGIQQRPVFLSECSAFLLYSLRLPSSFAVENKNPNPGVWFSSARRAYLSPRW